MGWQMRAVMIADDSTLPLSDDMEVIVHDDGYVEIPALAPRFMYVTEWVADELTNDDEDA